MKYKISVQKMRLDEGDSKYPSWDSVYEQIADDSENVGPDIVGRVIEAVNRKTIVIEHKSGTLPVGGSFSAGGSPGGGGFYPAPSGGMVDL